MVLTHASSKKAEDGETRPFSQTGKNLREPEKHGAISIEINGELRKTGTLKGSQEAASIRALFCLLCFIPIFLLRMVIS